MKREEGRPRARYLAGDQPVRPDRRRSGAAGAGRRGRGQDNHPQPGPGLRARRDQDGPGDGRGRRRPAQRPGPVRRRQLQHRRSPWWRRSRRSATSTSCSAAARRRTGTSASRAWRLPSCWACRRSRSPRPSASTAARSAEARAWATPSRRVEVSTPCVVTVSNELGEPRYPKLPQIMAAARKQVTVWTAADLGLSADAGRRGRAAADPGAPVHPGGQQQGRADDGDGPEEMAVALAQAAARRQADLSHVAMHRQQVTRESRRHRAPIA